jgi:hypothetical protein
MWSRPRCVANGDRRVEGCATNRPAHGKKYARTTGIQSSRVSQPPREQELMKTP